MTLVNILHMNTGNGDLSYANNSFFTKTVMQKVAPLLKRTIKGMATQDVFFDHCFVVADLGCSSGMNTLLLASNIIDKVHEVCQKNNHETPQIQVFLNDLFGNDFNNLFKLLPNFYETLKKDKKEEFSQCFVSAVPGSFYKRLFSDESLHIVHSSYSLHWLSQVPEGIENNKLNIHISETSPQNVLQAYEKQFHSDFTKFLQLRSKELVHGGRMVLTLPSRSCLNPTSDYCGSFFELLTISLLEMFNEELVRESDINSFNLPMYFPHENELRNIIQADGSFSLDNMNVFEANVDEHDTDYNTRGRNAAKSMRAVMEPLFTSLFGNSIIDVLFKKYEKYATERLATKETRHFIVVVSLTKIK